VIAALVNFMESALWEADVKIFRFAKRWEKLTLMVPGALTQPTKSAVA
jgi:hypothetical protein